MDYIGFENLNRFYYFNTISKVIIIDNNYDYLKGQSKFLFQIIKYEITCLKIKKAYKTKDDTIPVLK